MLRTLLCLIILLGLVSCRTSDKPEEAEVTAEEADAETSRSPFDGEDQFSHDSRLGLDASQKLYLKMITVEINAGVTVPKDKLHSSVGTIECRNRGLSRDCDLRVRLHDARLSNSQPVPEGVTATVQDYLQETRRDLTQKKVQIVDVHCDYVGKKSPPYDVEDVGCTLRHPRSVNEVIFKGRSAQVISEGLRAEQEFGSIKKQVAGTILCQWIDTVGRNQCLVRPMIGSVLLERVIPLSHSEGHVIGQQIRSSYLDQMSLKAAPNAAVDSGVAVPTEILGTVGCVVDSTKFDLSGHRDFSCRIVL